MLSNPFTKYQGVTWYLNFPDSIQKQTFDQFNVQSDRGHC
jgi:hypothetical protein